MNAIYLNFSSKNTVKDSCASVISCKSSSNENASFIAFMTWQQQNHSHGTTQTNYKLYQYPLLHPVIDQAYGQEGRILGKSEAEIQLRWPNKIGL